MKILIIAEPTDSHAVAVQWGLKQMGQVVSVWNWSDFPARSSGSCWIERDGSVRADIIHELENLDGPFDVIWNRRATLPVPRQYSNECDYRVIKAESHAFLKSVIRHMGNSSTRWVNSFESALLGRDKLHQLVIAAAHGLTVPDTLVSNDSQAIRSFIVRHRERTVFKSFTAGGWYNDTSMTVLRTSMVDLSYLADVRCVEQCPGIYQEMIEKDYEVRVTVMGGTILAVALHSQKQKATVDWRYDVNLADLPVEEIVLPPEIEKKCIAVCRELGLAFGCIDLIVDRAGNYVFLEVNEAGQFLWIEERAPTIPCLAMFCGFLTSSSTNKVKDQKISLAAFDQSSDFLAWSQPQKKRVKDSPIFSRE